MKNSCCILQIVTACLLVGTVNASEPYTRVGGDVYVSGSGSEISANAPRDVFAVGFSPSITSTVAGDLHIAGFSVETSSAVGADLYAVGSAVEINGAVKGDLTVTGFSVELNEGASVSGNARLAAGSLSIEAPIAGTLLAGAGEVHLDSTVNGDVRLSAQEISFGSNARILGLLNYSGPEQLSIPESVISADRVTYTPLTSSGFVEDVHETVDESFDSLWPPYIAIFSGFFITLAFLLIVAALALAFAPVTVFRLREQVQNNLGKSLLFGVIGLATLVGLLPVSATTLIGLPFIPFVILAIVLAWTLAYLLGAFALSMRVAEAFSQAPASPGGKLLVLGSGLIVCSLLNYIPVVGWLFNYAVMLLGLGAMTAAVFARFNWHGPVNSPSGSA
ncbi:MAG: hypothetical protein AB8C46_06425 [Burkholderiaceae bacterium]